MRFSLKFSPPTSRPVSPSPLGASWKKRFVPPTTAAATRPSRALLLRCRSFLIGSFSGDKQKTLKACRRVCRQTYPHGFIRCLGLFFWSCGNRRLLISNLKRSRRRPASIFCFEDSNSERRAALKSQNFPNLRLEGHGRNGNNAGGCSNNLAGGVLALIRQCLSFVMSQRADFNIWLWAKDAADWLLLENFILFLLSANWN